METEKILQAIADLSGQVRKLSNIQTAIQTKYRSDDCKDLFAALAKAQSEMSMAGLNSENPYFKSKYADLADMVRASRPSLTKYGLSIIQQIIPNDEGSNVLHTLLCHLSGQWIESRMKITPAKNDIQSMGSYITYLRRYSMAALCGIVSSNDDDDGEIAMEETRKQIVKGPTTKYNPREQSMETITKEQLEELEYELHDWPDLAEDIIEGFQIRSLADVPKNQFIKSLTRVRQIKLARAGAKTIT